jgi:SAM-dependent methyltransferase
LVWLFLEQRTELFRRHSRVLHIAPEPSLQERLTRLQNLDYLSGDLESPGAMVKMDVTDIPYGDACFDAVLCLHVLEHVADDRAAMRELLRVLKPGGWAIVQCPVEGDETFEDATIVSARERRRIFGQDDHLRVYGRDLELRLRSAGFVVDVIPFARQLGDEACRRYGLDPSECIYLTRKPTSGRS